MNFFQKETHTPILSGKKSLEYNLQIVVGANLQIVVGENLQILWSSKFELTTTNMSAAEIEQYTGHTRPDQTPW